MKQIFMIETHKGITEQHIDHALSDQLYDDGDEVITVKEINNEVVEK